MFLKLKKLTFNKLKRRLTDRFLGEGKIWDKILTGPREVRVNPMGFVCNHDCIMCWRETLSIEERKTYMRKEKNSLSLGDYKRLFKKLPFRTRSIDVTGGGEPFLYPQTFQILEAIKENGLYGHLMTNGALLTPSIIRKLINIKWNMIRISFHAGDKESYQTIHRRNDFKKVCQAIEMLVRLRGKTKKFPRVSLLFVIQRANFDRIREFSALAERLGVDEIEFDNLIPIVAKTILRGKEIIAVQKDLRKVAQFCQVPNNALEVVKRYDKLYGRHISDNSPVPLSKKRFSGKKCKIVLNSMFITNEGDVHPCCFFKEKMGNVKDASILEIWNSVLYEKLRQSLGNGQFEPECFKYCPYDLNTFYQ